MLLGLGLLRLWVSQPRALVPPEQGLAWALGRLELLVGPEQLASQRQLAFPELWPVQRLVALEQQVLLVGPEPLPVWLALAQERRPGVPQVLEPGQA